jgi:hypothetical protein
MKIPPQIHVVRGMWPTNGNVIILHKQCSSEPMHKYRYILAHKEVHKNVVHAHTHVVEYSGYQQIIYKIEATTTCKSK